MTALVLEEKAQGKTIPNLLWRNLAGFLEEMAQGKTIPNLFWRSLAAFSDLLTVRL